MIGEKVPEDDSRWQLFLTILTIMDYVFAPVTDEDDIYIRYLIGSHHCRFCGLYPHCSIIPKQHYLLHAVEWMER